LKDEIWIVALAIGLFPTAVFHLLRWAGAPQKAMNRPLRHAFWAIAALALAYQAFWLLKHE
jgi:hypothetical protein